MTLQELGFKDGEYYLIQYLSWSDLTVSLIFTSSSLNFEAQALVDDTPPRLGRVTKDELVGYLDILKGEGRSSSYLEFPISHQRYQCLVNSWINQK